MQAATTLAGKEAPEGIERRRDKRYSVMVPGVVIRRDGYEVRCVTDNLSATGFEILCGTPFQVGEQVSLILHHLERVDVEVMRLTPRGFGARILRTSLGRPEFMRQVKVLIDGQAGAGHAASGGADQRRHHRHVPSDRDTQVQLMGGHPIPARLIDVSQGGAAVECHLMVQRGRRILLGRRPSKVVRVFAGGFAVEFDTPLEARGASVPASVPSSVDARPSLD